MNKMATYYTVIGINFVSMVSKSLRKRFSFTLIKENTMTRDSIFFRSDLIKSFSIDLKSTMNDNQLNYIFYANPAYKFI